jgi:hypothetical protein
MTDGRRQTAVTAVIALALLAVLGVAAVSTVCLRHRAADHDRRTGAAVSTSPSPTPYPSPSPDLTVQVVGTGPAAKSAPGPLTVALIAAGVGGAVSLVTSFGAQALVRRYERRRRRSTRQTARLDGLIAAVQELEVAYANDALTNDPDVETQVELMRASRAFDRALALVSDPGVKELAKAWQRLAEQEALERGGAPEDATVTQQDVAAADTALMEMIRGLEGELE